MTTPSQDKRSQANQDFQASLNQLEERFLSDESNGQGPSGSPTKLPLPLKTEHRLPFRYNSTATLSQQDFDLESLQDAVADIDQFIQRRG